MIERQAGREARQEIWEVLVELTRTYGHTTVTGVADWIGISKGIVHYHLQRQTHRQQVRRLLQGGGNQDPNRHGLFNRHE